MDVDNPRIKRLHRLFSDVIDGKEELNSRNVALFFQAICIQPEPVACVNKILGSKAGLKAIQQAVFMNLTAEFMNKEVTPVLMFLQTPELKTVNSGAYLDEIVLKLVEPDIFWNAFRTAFLKQQLNDKAQLSLGWLLYQLCSLSNDIAEPYRNHQDTSTILGLLLDSTILETRTIGQKLKQVLDTFQAVSANDIRSGAGPGGRHDNDHEDFRKIAILPTADELLSKERPFLRPADVLEDPETAPTRVAMHLDNQFRLLREDMVYEMREELQGVLDKKKGGSRRAMKITGLDIADIECGKMDKRIKWGLVFKCWDDIPQLKKFDEKDKKGRAAYIDKTRGFLKPQSLACIMSGDEIIAFPTIYRDRDDNRLAKFPPEIVLQFDGTAEKALQRLKMSKESITLIQINTALFAYEPILKQLQETTRLPLSSELLLWTESSTMSLVSERAIPVIQALERDPNANLQELLQTKDTIRLDKSQCSSLLSGLNQPLSLLQGPPGTGKSFIGALLAKSIYLYTEQTILVVCYTNHALDDILESLLKIGIPAHDMVRLGGKSTTATEPLKIQHQARGKRTGDQWTIINELKNKAEMLSAPMLRSFDKYSSDSVRYDDIMLLLEFDFPIYFEAFTVPESEDGMIIVGGDGKAIKPTYLIERWCNNHDAGVLKLWSMQDPTIAFIWNLLSDERQEMCRNWEHSITKQNIQEFCEDAEKYTSVLDKLSQAQNAGNSDIFQTKRIVGCTTTAAAKYSEDMKTFNADVLLVEEAGEILESHILTALGLQTSQVILIGDHKQLRPKVNNYALTIEKGEGYDLNRSLFERLILKKYPHETLTQQHRMRPEISALIRNLTYPELVDAPSTFNRPNILGLQDNIVFIDHNHQEDEFKELKERRESDTSSSKQNSFETEIVLKIVKYLGQQGYKTDDLVILTPYLGQLQNLRNSLAEDNDIILNDLDSYELVRAGLINSAEAKLTKKAIRLATIDNYQGEESKIVIISLTRSNPRGDIGFMFSPERLNVLLSRSRDGLIMVGNMDTFMNARNPKGKDLWTRLFNDLRHKKHLYEGLPVKCERHPDRTLILSQPEQFEDACPDGGCNEPCGVILACGVHACPSKCHLLSDHSKAHCQEKISSLCQNGHTMTSACSDGPPKNCSRCDREIRLAKEKQKRDEEAKQKRDEEQQAHLKHMDALNAEIAEKQRTREDQRLAQERAIAIRQKEDDLAAYTAAQTPVQSAPTGTFGSHPPTSQHPDPVYLPPDVENISPPMDLDGRDSPEISGPISNSSTLPHSDGASGPSSSGAAFATPKPIVPKPFPQIQVSQSYLEWTRQKNVNGTTNPHVDAIMDMTGLEKVKEQLLETIAKIEASKRQNAPLMKERFNIVFLGNPGTGKTTVARHYAKFLASMGVTPGSHYVETTGSSLANEGVSGAKKIVDDAIKEGGGTIFIDEAYQLTSGHSHGGAAVLDFLLAEMENRVGTIVFILAGYNKEMEKFFEHNPGLMSRVPHQLKFEDYKDEELMAIFEDLIKKTFHAKMRVEGGVQGLYGRIVIRRLARRRGHPGFGNARDVQTTFARIRGRQAERLSKLRKAGGRPDDFTFSAEDLIGPDPSKVVRESKAWNRLQSLIGLGAVKKSVTSLLALIQENYQRELLELEPIGLTLNRIFLCSPGTGKTTVAKLYGQILVDLGMLSNGEVIIKNPSDFIGAVLGASEANTKAILANTIGKVLVIDEAYMLYDGGGESGGQSNQFKTTVIDTMVAEIQSVPGEDRCVLLLGYTDQMLNMFQHVNPGLTRRFRIEDAFKFEDFDEAELRAILDLKLKEQDLDATEQAKKVAIGLLNRGRNLPNFGNAGEVENIISKAKIHCIARRAEEPISERPNDIVFSPEDFDPDHNRAANASTNLFKLFEDIVGRQDVIDKLRNFQEISRACKERNMDPKEQIPTNFVFTGPPGTGKTTIARKVGQVFYDMDFLGSAEVVECSASDLVGQYVGQTGPKTKKLFEKALGKVLFIDEAYRLGEGHFAQEAIDEVVGLVTQPRFKSNLVIILAGYENDINKLMTANAGLSSRFPDQITFENMDAESCISVVKKELAKKSVVVEDIDDSTSMLYIEMKEIIRDMSELNDWGNARDMITLSKDIINLALRKHDASATRLEISGADVLGIMKQLLADRQRRSKIQIKPRRTAQLPQQTFTANPPTPPPVSTTTDTHVSNESVPDSPRTSRSATPNSPSGRGRGQGAVRGRGRARATGRNSPNLSRPGPSRSTAAPSEGDPERDPGVSDAIWQQSSAAKRAAIELERKATNEVHRLKQAAAKEKAKETQEKKTLEDLQNAADAERDAKLKDDLLRQREQARIKAHSARVAREKAEAALRAKQEAERKRKEQEEKAQRKLREMGVCPAGYRWINVGSHYRCAGGSHLVSIDSLGL